MTINSETYRMLNDFESKGFVPYTAKNGHFLQVLRTRFGEYYRIFRSTHHGNKSKNYIRHGPFEIFGKKLLYYYDIRRKEEFVDFLVQLFYEKNPQADKHIKKVFSRILNYHGLSWSQNQDENKINEETKNVPIRCPVQSKK